MKPEVIIQQGLKSANILLKNVQKRAAELDHLKGEIVLITDANGKTFKGFFRNVEFISKLPILGHPLLDGRQQAPV